MTATFVASCTCGDVTLESARAPILQLTCHCGQCRQASGAPSTNFAFFKRAEATVAGETKAMAFVADSGSGTVRESCARCGALMFDRSDGFAQLIGVVAERLRPPYVFQPRCHVWLDSRVGDPVLPDGVKAFERGMG